MKPNFILEKANDDCQSGGGFIQIFEKPPTPKSTIFHFFFFSLFCFFLVFVFEFLISNENHINAVITLKLKLKQLSSHHLAYFISIVYGCGMDAFFISFSVYGKPRKLRRWDSHIKFITCYTYPHLLLLSYILSTIKYYILKIKF